MKIELFPKQAEFFFANNRINIYGGGIQSGKTTGGALKMLQSILDHQSPDDNFIICADTYKTLAQATVPRFVSLAKPYGRLNRQAGEFKTIWGSTVYLRTATDPESLEGITNVRRIWLDEGGKVSKYFFENVMGRAAFFQCPIDITTTPYAMNWLADLTTDYKKGKRDDVFFVQCRSIDSPYFPKDEYNRQKKLLDSRRFTMKYDGVFGKMEGLVFDRLNLCNSFKLEHGTVYYAGVDWGFNPDPFALVVRGLTPEGKHYRVAEYYRNFLTISDIVNVIRSFKALYNFKTVFCDPSEPAHIEELNRSGIPALAAKNDLRYGIDKHYELIKAKRFFVFEDMNPIGIDEYNTYHYKEQGELKFNQGHLRKHALPVDKDNHGIDADRYITVSLTDNVQFKRAPHVPGEYSPRAPRTNLAARIDWLKKRGGKSKIVG